VPEQLPDSSQRLRFSPGIQSHSQEQILAPPDAEIPLHSQKLQTAHSIHSEQGPHFDRLDWQHPKQEKHRRSQHPVLAGTR
jgi:hypothetical protein